MSSKLSDIFVPEVGKFHYSKRELLSLELHEKFIGEIAKHLDISYMKNGSKENNFCFVDHEHLRPAYKMFFAKSDIMDYLRFALNADEFDIRTAVVPFPEREVFFTNQ